ncbi:xanthine dehydrogenase family protein subunit M [Borreliella carolinensis]|uniref:xanthine dehydrogenase family protein subunit M n=1 Tax=Borreliella carolinensis TaxID=478174 RepID=UPI00294344FD|nr:xanthine dehydrogenase family protein subunit M [Borreliella carolinensis]WNY65088.1 xanthine dehydrogenase family protein subunit M [Borreliella carolinensis]
MANVKVYYPESFNILSNLFNKNLNNYIIYNELDFKKNPSLFNRETLVDNFFIVGNFEKFNKVSLRGNFLEMGPCVTYNEILQIGKKNIPSLFYEFISKFNDKIYLNSINLANGFYYKNTVFDIYPLLLSLDAQIEFKNILTKKTYVFSAYNLNRAEYIANRSTILVTKFKFPMMNLWNRSFYHKIFFNTLSFDILEEADIIFICILLNIKRDIISDFLLKIFYDDKVIVIKDFQVLLLNKSLPLSFSEIENSLKMLDKNIRDFKNFNIGERNLKLIKNFYLDILMSFNF